MVVIRGDLNYRMDRFFYDSIQGPLEEFCSNSACAGIKDDPDNANKARMNHYGWYRTYPSGETRHIPSRRFIEAAIHNFAGDGVNQGWMNASEIERMLRKKINSRPRIQKRTDVSVPVPGQVYATGAPVMKSVQRTTQRGLSPVKGKTKDYDEFFQKVADKMAERLRNAIDTKNIIGDQKNADSTKKRKGFDHVLVDTMDMRNAIEGWAE